MDTMPLTAADVGAVVGNRGYDGYGMDGCGAWFWIIIILMNYFYIMHCLIFLLGSLFLF